MQRLIITAFLLLLAAQSLAGENSEFQLLWDQTWQGDYQTAVKGYRHFVKAYPDDPKAPAALYNAASLSFQKLHDLKAARRDLLTLTEKYPDSRWTAGAYQMLAQIALQQQDNQAASENFQHALTAAQGKTYQMPDSWISSLVDEWQNHLATLQDPALQVAAYQEVIPLMPPGESVARAQSQLATALEQLLRQEEAAQLLAEMMLSFPAGATCARALEEKRDLVSQHLVFPWTELEKYRRAAALGRQMQYAEMQKLLEEINAQVPDTKLGENAQFSLIPARVYLSGDFQQGLVELGDYTKRYPNGLRARDSARRQESWEDILRLKELVKEDPQDYETQAQLGYTLLQSGFFPQAEEPLLAAAQDTTSDRALLGLGQIYLRAGASEKGIQCYERYLQNHPEEGDVYNQVGYAYLQGGQAEKALECFARYRDLQPDNPNAHDSYAEGLLTVGRLEEAITEYQKAMELSPDFSNPYFMLGEIYRQKGEIENALKYYRLYLERDPNGAQVIQARAQIEELTRK